MIQKLKTTPARSKMMSKIHSTGGKGEVLLAKRLWHKGIRYRKNYKKLPGKPDIAITRYKIAVFIDGEFWHGYDWANQKDRRMHRNHEFWVNKIEGNMARDRRQTRELENMGWTVLRFWEKNEVLRSPSDCVKKVLSVMKNK